MIRFNQHKSKILVIFNLFLIIALWLISCHRPIQPSPRPLQKNTTSLPKDQQVRPVHVLLGQTENLFITCKKLDTLSPADFFILDDGKGALNHIPAAAQYHLCRKNNTWQLLDAKNNDLLTQYPIFQNNITFQPSPNSVIELAMLDNPADIPTAKPTGYRGTLQVKCESSDYFSVINHVDLEDYLLGVVGAEMPASWAISALEAQCIAARTYVMYHMYVDPLNQLWDVKNTQASQVYGGLPREHPRVTQAVNTTAGVVLTYGPHMAEKIFPAYFSAICGGHTQNAAPVFGQKLKPLTGKPCPYCQQNAPQNRFNWPEITLSKKELSDLILQRDSQLATLQEVVSIRVTATSDYGRVKRVELTGKNGKRLSIRGEDFRLAVTTAQKPLLSSWFTMVDTGKSWQFKQGHGWGHGVGLCQYGCRQMADNGQNCLDILSFYYPQSTLVKVF
ncbi:MAG: SpoIID/LytB domain-containing protein [Phycisphaerae bacterium]|nr:SpoIID/LytB domain-containing protein [Phycisphaerae bacterium]